MTAPSTRRHRAAGRRDLRRPLVLRRQGATDTLIKAAIEHRGRRFPRRDLALRRLQQSRRLDQELRLRARAQRAVNRLDFITGRATHQGRLPPGASNWSSSTTARRSPCARSIPSTTCRRVAAGFLQDHAAKGGSSPASSTSRESEDLHGHLNTVDAPLVRSAARLCPARRRSTRSTPVCGEPRLPALRLAAERSAQA